MTGLELAEAIDSVLSYAPPSLETEQFDAMADLVRALREGAQVVRPGDVLSSKEAAVLLGKDRTTVSRWKSSGYLPAPFTEVGAGPLWLREALEDFKKDHATRADGAGRRPLGSATTTAG